jgi:hypothetical protein
VALIAYDVSVRPLTLELAVPSAWRAVLLRNLQRHAGERMRLCHAHAKMAFSKGSSIMGKRDNFTELTRVLLRERVGGRCSKPDCRKATTGPKLNGHGAVRLGRAAHITAAAAGGPRYSKLLTQAQRRHIDNAIWLCNDHADEVDADQCRYSVDELRRWKAEAEQRAHDEIGKPLPCKEDAINQAIAVLGAAPGKFVPTAINNTHQAVSSILRELDPTATVRTEYIDGRTCFHVESAEPIRITLKRSSPFADDLDEVIGAALRNGEDVEVPMSRLSVTGSPVIELLAKQANQLIIGGVPHDAVVRVGTKSDDDDLSLSMEFRGEAKFGTESASIVGSCCGGALGTRLGLPITNDGAAPTWTLDVSFACWDGQPLAALPHFERASRFIRALASGALTMLEVEINGRTCLKTIAHGPTDPQQFKKLERAFGYIEAARAIGRHLGASVTLKHGVNQPTAQSQEVEQLADMVRSIKEPRKLGDDDVITIDVRVTKDMLDDLDHEGDRLLKVVTPARCLTLFGTPVQVPSLTTILSHVGLELRSRGGRKAKKGEVVAFICRPGPHAYMQTWLS